MPQREWELTHYLINVQFGRIAHNVLQCYSSKNDGTKVKSNTYIYIYYNIYKYKVEFGYRNTLLENCNTVTA